MLFSILWCHLVPFDVTVRITSSTFGYGPMHSYFQTYTLSHYSVYFQKVFVYGIVQVLAYGVTVKLPRLLAVLTNNFSKNHEDFSSLVLKESFPEPISIILNSLSFFKHFSILKNSVRILRFSVGICSADVSISGNGTIYCYFYWKQHLFLRSYVTYTHTQDASPSPARCRPPLWNGADGGAEGRGRHGPNAEAGLGLVPGGSGPRPPAVVVKRGTPGVRSPVISELVLLTVPERKDTRSRRPDGTPRGRLVPHPLPASLWEIAGERGCPPPGRPPPAVPYPPGWAAPPGRRQPRPQGVPRSPPAGEERRRDATRRDGTGRDRGRKGGEGKREIAQPQLSRELPGTATRQL